MNFQFNYKKVTAFLTLLAVLSLAACGQGNQPATDTPANQTPVTTNTPAANTSATTAGFPPIGNDCPGNAPVKGVDTAKRGKIYHTTNYPDYQQVKATICFRDAASAEQAGYQLPQAK
jgi:hypothetical protein